MMREYVLVHLVVQEADKPLIGPQVVDHATSQARASGPGAPAAVVVAFLEPARRAMQPRVRESVRRWASRSRGVRVLLLPFIGRLGRRINARLLARRIAAVSQGRALVLHCRGEASVEWGDALAEHLEGAGIVADIRGAWPEELLFARGYDGVGDADPDARAVYETAMRVTRAATTRADQVLSVSAGMLNWLRGIGVPDDKLGYVPCCTTGVTFDSASRAALRARLGLTERLVLCYSGTITRYQHVEDGVLPFFRAASEELPELHLLCLTPDALRMRSLAGAAGIDPSRMTVHSLPQHEVPAYLSAADAGLLLRAPSTLNLLSQPTKFAEYLAAGLPVIVSHGTGDVPRIVTESAAGTAVTFFGSSDSARDREALDACASLREHASVWRANAIALCEREFVWSVYTDQVRSVYRNCIGRSTLHMSTERVLT